LDQDVYFNVKNVFDDPGFLRPGTKAVFVLYKNNRGKYYAKNIAPVYYKNSREV